MKESDHMTEPWDALWIDARLATLETPAPFGAIEQGAIAVAGDRIAWVGREADLPGPPESCAPIVHRARGRWITPGLVDCHTHLIFAGERIREFELRIAGATREALRAAGGGILETTRLTRTAGEAELIASAQARLRRLMAEGVTTIEIKSGYGLDRDVELRMLRIARALGRSHPVSVVTSFLGTHGLPPDYAGRAEAYVAFLCDEVLPAAVAEGLVDICDGGSERGAAIGQALTARLFARAKSLGLPVRAHADQYADSGGGGFVAEQGGLSADHLEYVSEDSIREMAKAGTVAVLLPGATFFLREEKRPPVELFRRHGVTMALATNCNPGSAPVLSPLLIMAMACTMFRLTPEEALRGMTIAGARALGRAGRIGTLSPGKQADFVVWDVEQPAELVYWLGANPCQQVVQGGRIAKGADAL